MSLKQQIINMMPSHRGRRALQGLRNLESGEAVPASGLKGYEPGQTFHLKNAVLGQSYNWVNIGTIGSSLFVPVGQQPGYGIAFAGGPVSLTDAADETYVSLPGVIKPADICFASKCITDSADQFKTVGPVGSSDDIVTSGVGGLLIDMAMGGNPTDSLDAYYMGLRNKCTPEWDIFAAGKYTAVGADDDTVAITVTGALSTDIAFVTPTESDDTDTVDLVVMTANTLTITVSADPVTEHGYNYVIIRPRGTFKPSHYLAYVNQQVTVGTAVYETLTETGVLSTDVVIGQWNTSDDDDCFIEALLAQANGLRLQCTDDPSTAHNLSYLVARSY